MNKRSYWLVLLGGLAALLLAGVGCQTDIKPVEDRVGTVEQDLSAVETKLTSLEGETGTMSSVKQDLSAVEVKLASLEGRTGKISSPASKVMFTVTGVEWKGSTTVDSLAAPSADPGTLSNGYRFKKPGDFDKSDPKKWEVSSYVWSPGAMTVLQGDEVTLRVFILNGDKHDSWIAGPDGKEAVSVQTLNRGREYTLRFTASQVGHYMLHCSSHAPTMDAVITVLPRT
jgi:plastocyanin